MRDILNVTSRKMYTTFYFITARHRTHMLLRLNYAKCDNKISGIFWEKILYLHYNYNNIF